MHKFSNIQSIHFFFGNQGQLGIPAYAIPKRFLYIPTTNLLFQELTAITDKYTSQDPPPHLNTMGQGLLFDTFPELGNDDNDDPISKLTLREFYDNLLNPPNIHTFREMFQRHSEGDSTCRTARIHFRLHYGHFSEVCSQLEEQLRNNADIAAFTVTCTQIKAHFDTFRSHRRDMRRAAQDLDSKLETYFIRATNYTEEETIYDDYRNDPAWQGGNVDLSAMY